MIRRKVPKKNKKQIGVLFDPDIWRKFKSTATMQDSTAGEALEELMIEYIKKHNK
jgi:hypothetical protein